MLHDAQHFPSSSIPNAWEATAPLVGSIEEWDHRPESGMYPETDSLDEWIQETESEEDEAGGVSLDEGISADSSFSEREGGEMESLEEMMALGVVEEAREEARRIGVGRDGFFTVVKMDNIFRFFEIQGQLVEFRF